MLDGAASGRDHKGRFWQRYARAVVIRPVLLLVLSAHIHRIQAKETNEWYSRLPVLAAAVCAALASRSSAELCTPCERAVTSCNRFVLNELFVV